jgi:hypothetical protein
MPMPFIKNREMQTKRNFLLTESLNFIQNRLIMESLFLPDLFNEEKEKEMLDIETGDTFHLNGHNSFDMNRFPFSEVELTDHYSEKSEDTPSFLGIEL